MLQRSTIEIECTEKVEKIPCGQTAADAIVLLFTWHGVGHHELVTFNEVITLPHSHALIQHLDALHQQCVSGFNKNMKEHREERRGKRRNYDQNEVVE